jgi:hypothetical protein
MPDIPLDETLTKKEALASLHTSVGWSYMKKYLKVKQKELRRKLETVSPKDSEEIAAIQAELKLINVFIDKPKLSFERLQNGG